MRVLYKMEACDDVCDDVCDSFDDSCDDSCDDDSFIEELDQLVLQSDLLCEKHQEALKIMHRIQDSITDVITIPYHNEMVDLDHVLEELHQKSLAHLDETGEITFGSLLLAALEDVDS